MEVLVSLKVVAPRLLNRREAMHSITRTLPCPALPPPRSPERAAIAEFLRGTALGWTKRDLATWLVCHYSPCLAADAAVHPDGRRALGARPATPIDDDSLEAAILSARCRALRLLADLGQPRLAAAIARDAVARGHVLGRRDRTGRIAWAPVGRARMRLAERVASLIVADCLNSPADYRRAVVCRGCSELGFGALAHADGCTRIADNPRAA